MLRPTLRAFTAKNLVNELGAPPAVPMSIVKVKLSNPIDGHDVFVFMLISEFEYFQGVV